MTLVKWEPRRELEELLDRMTKVWGPRPLANEQLGSADWAPRVDIAETPEEFVVKAELPEVQKEDVHVTVENGVLTLRGERKQEKEEKDKKFHRIERLYGSFARTFALPEHLDEKGIKASFKDGMLTIQLPKRGEPQARAVQVEVE